MIQSNYLPWKGYFDIIASVDTFIFYDCTKYTKNDWRNRNIIYTKNGKQWLTIPVTASAVNLCVDEVCFNSFKWQREHAKSLQNGYSRSPFFFQLEELIQKFYIDRQWESLSILNIELTSWICKKIGINTRLCNARELKGHQPYNYLNKHEPLSPYDKNINKIKNILNILEPIGTTEYLTGPRTSNYITGNEYMFHNKHIKLTYKQYPNYPEYKQLSTPFEQAVSIVDMIANIDWIEILSYIKSPSNVEFSDGIK